MDGLYQNEYFYHDVEFQQGEYGVTSGPVVISTV